MQFNRERIQQLTAAASAAEGLTTSAKRLSRGENFDDARIPNATWQEESQQISRIVPAMQPSQTSWIPAAFSNSVKEGMQVFHHAGKSWVLFRDGAGTVACIEDCCAHRACPLSLVRT